MICILVGISKDKRKLKKITKNRRKLMGQVTAIREVVAGNVKPSIDLPYQK